MNYTMRSVVVTVTSILLLVGCANAQDANGQAANQQQGKLTQQSSLDDVLNALDRRGRDLRSISADVKMTDVDLALNDKTARSGSFKLQNRTDGSTRAHIVFDRKMIEDRTISEKIEYLLDGGKLIDRNYRTKTQTTRTVLRPGEKVNLLKLGEGPFPLPIGQKPEEVLAQFEVTKIAPAADDPEGTLHLQLVPKPKTSFARKFQSIDAWVKLDDELPVRIKTIDFNGNSERVTDLSNVKINPDLQDADFTLPKLEGDWNFVEEPFHDPTDKRK